MSKKYDFFKAKQIIEDNQETLVEASLGMREDWLWTAETVWDDGKFTQDLNKLQEIAGIGGSTWATPVVRLLHEDGTDEVFECYTGESSGTNPFDSLITSLPLSRAQENIPLAKKWESDSK